MKNFIVITLLLTAFTARASEVAKNTPYKKASTVHTELKQSPTVDGPFLLTIKAITEAQHKTYLHTQQDPTAANNIVLEIPPYVKNHYFQNFKSDLKSLFLNQNLIVKGQAKIQSHQWGDKTTSEQKIPTIKIIFNDQLSHYD